MRHYAITPQRRPGARSYSATFVNATGKRVTRGLGTDDTARADLTCKGLVLLRHALPRTMAQAPTDVPLDAIRLYFEDEGASGPALDFPDPGTLSNHPHRSVAEAVMKYPPRFRTEIASLMEERGRLLRENTQFRLDITLLKRNLDDECRRRISIEQTVVARLAKAQASAPQLVTALVEFEKHILSISTRRNARDHVNGVKKFLLTLPVTATTAADIEPSHVMLFLDAQSGRGSPTKTMSRRRAWRIRLSRFFSWIEQVHGLPSPMVGVPSVTKTAVLRERGDIHWHRLEEIQAVLKSLPDDYWRAVVATLAFAGLQLAELVWLRKTDVEIDGDRARFWVTTVEDPDDPKSKHLLKTGHRRRHVDIHPVYLLPLIRKQVENAMAFLFPAHVRISKKGKPCKRRGAAAESERWVEGSLSTRLRGHPGGRDKKKRPSTMGLLPKGMTAKSLRRTFGSLLLRSGKSTAEVAAAMGNTEQVVRENYARILGCEVDVDF